MKIAVVHDWLISYAGAEKVLKEILSIYKNADVYVVIESLNKSEKKFLEGHKVFTSFIQKVPFSKKIYRNLMPLMPIAIEQFDLSDYDLIISSSHAVAKGVITGPGQKHISYVHSPIRYAWDMQGQYINSLGKNFIKRNLARGLMHYMRNWDLRTANGVDYFVSNSNFIKERIWKVYRREAYTIYPPVDVENFMVEKQKENYYLTASRLVPYKKVVEIVKAFNQMPDKSLKVVGEGPELQRIKQIAHRNIEVMGYLPNQQMQEVMQKARAFIFNAKEDFGISPVEAQATGTPVIAYGVGGSHETVNDLNEKKDATGILYFSQDAQSIREAVKKFEMNEKMFNYLTIRENAERFSSPAFRNNFKQFVDEKLDVKG